MYTAFYGLREKPFALSPDPRFLYLAESHREALAHLLYGIDQGEGFIAVTGEVGTGKTTLCRTLLERLGSETAVAFLFNPSHSAQELLEAIAAEFELAVTRGTRRELGDALNAFLLDQKREGRRVLLIVDEAQNLSSETLEQLRLLSNLETASQKLIQILLLGQPELDAKLDSPELRQLRQRIGVRWSLMSLQSTETREYVRHRLRVAAGAEREIFSEPALREIHRRSGGVPRLVNVLCDRSLLSGYASRRHDIDARLVRRVAEEIPDTRRPSRSVLQHPRLRIAMAVSSVALVGVAGVLAAGIDWGPRAVPAVASDAVALPEVSSQPPVAVPIFDARPAAVQQPASMPPKLAGSFGTLLEQLEPSASRLRALNGVLAAYSEPGYAEPPASDFELRALLASRGLSVLALPDADFDTLRTLNHPALLSVRTPRGGQRTVALVKLVPGAATLFGVRLGGVVEVPPEELARDWNGRAFVVWRDFEAVPEVLAAGAVGGAVEWLQSTLEELGVYAGPPSGRYDEATLRGVRALQVGRRLVPDGAVGPRTKMVLYDLSKRYDVPRLIAGDASG